MRKHIGKLLVLILVVAAFGFAGSEDMKAEQNIAATTSEVEQAGIVYSMPSAYRKASPTQEQMDSLEALAVLQPLVRR